MYLIYVYKQDLVLNNLQRLVCHKTKSDQTKPNHIVRCCIIAFFLTTTTTTIAAAAAAATRATSYNNNP